MKRDKYGIPYEKAKCGCEITIMGGFAWQDVDRMCDKHKKQRDARLKASK